MSNNRPNGTFQNDGLPDRVVVQGEVRFCRARVQLVPYLQYEQVGYDFRSGYEVLGTVIRVLDTAGKQIGTATLEPQSDGLWAEVAIDYSTPERLDAELGKLFALPRGKLHLPAQTVPTCLDAEEGPAKFPLFRVSAVSIEAVVLTGRTQYPSRRPVEILPEDPPPSS